MHDEVAEIEQRPEAFPSALDAERLHARLFELFFLDRIENRADLAIILRRDDDEVIGHVDEVAHVLDDDVGRFLAVRRAGGDERLIQR